MGRKTILTIQMLFVSLFVMLLITFLFTNDIIISTPDDESSVVTGEMEDVEDGTYTGSGEGFNGPIEVEVTVENGAISDITILDHAESDGYSDPAFEEVPDAIIAGNTTDVDTVSGATATSNGIMAAVNNALFGDSESAPESDDGAEDVTVSDTVYDDGTFTGTADGYNGPIEVEVTVENGVISNIEILDHDETDGLSDPAFEEVPDAIIAQNTADVDVVSGVTGSSEAIMAAVNNALNGESDDDNDADEESSDDSDVVYEDGTYTATAEGHNGPIELELTIENGEMTEITILDHSETEDLTDPAFEEVPAAIIESNSTDVDVVSGVTVTSETIIEAVEDILENQAQ